MTAQPEIATQNQSPPYFAEPQRSPLVNLAQDFAALERPTQKEITRFREMFYVLVLRTTRHERKQISQSLSKSHFVPRQIAYYFCMEEVQVASSILMFSPVLKNEDLRQIIAKRQIDHACLIARRVGLDATTIVALLEKDDREGRIRKLLKQNTSVTVQQDLMDVIVRHENSTLMKTENATAKTAKVENFTPDTGSIHAKLVQRFSDINAGKRDTLTDKSKELLHVARLTNAGTEKDSDGLTSTDISLVEQVLASARASDMDRLSRHITFRTGLDHQYLMEIFRDENTGAQACLFKALSFQRSEISMLLLLLNRNIGRSVEVFRRVQAKLDNISIQKCRELFIAKGASFNAIEPSSSKKRGHESHFTVVRMARQREAVANGIEIATEQSGVFQQSA